MAASEIPLRDVERFLAERHGQTITDLEPLAGGFWSSALAYRVDGRELVVRFGQIREGFEMDRDAMAFDRADLPVPEVLDIGDAFGGAYAISVRHHGRFLESVTPAEAPVAGATIARLLTALRSVAPEPRPAGSTWRGWLLESLVDEPSRVTAGWRATLAADAELDRLFVACEKRIGELADACPERQDLLHGDLLHANVLVSEDASRVNAVFSWKCSQRGDFLFDVAWCTFWGHVYPAIAAADVWRRAVSAADVDAATRHHCYELQIGATHLGWNAWVGDQDGLRGVADHTAMLLERGPL